MDGGKGFLLATVAFLTTADAAMDAGLYSGQ